MIGDRADNDIIPAKTIGMKTVLVLIGAHRCQQLRLPGERPDYTIENIPALLDIPEIRTRL
nr:HAD hydrolase-like protein [candidate division Zixibacteria bacterium]